MNTEIHTALDEALDELRLTKENRTAIINAAAESAKVLLRQRDAALDAVAILLLDHQRIEPHHSDLCDICRMAKSVLEAR
jgi:hypothetical protein